MSFLGLGLTKLWFVFDLRDPGSSLVANDVVRNPWIWASIALCLVLLGAAVYLPGLRELLQARPLDARGVGVALAVSLLPFAVGQGLRLVQARRGPAGGMGIARATPGARRGDLPRP